VEQLLKYAEQMLKEAEHEFYESKDECDCGIVTGIDRIVKLIKRQMKGER